MTNTCATLDPKILGFWTRCIREAQHISQEALAASAGVDVRTVQRFEAGNAVSITSRRCLARGLGFEKADIFDDPAFATEVHKLLEGLQGIKDKELEKQHPDHVRVKAERVPNGAALGRLADCANALSLNSDDEISQEAKRAAAELFDYLRDLLDVGGDATFSDKLSFSESLETMLRELESLGTAAYSGLRSVKLTGENWADRTPLHLTIGYLAVVPEERNFDTIFVPRRVRLG